jgi:hypothetical protein
MEGQMNGAKGQASCMGACIPEELVIVFVRAGEEVRDLCLVANRLEKRRYAHCTMSSGRWWAASLARCRADRALLALIDIPLPFSIAESLYE